MPPAWFAESTVIPHTRQVLRLLKREERPKLDSLSFAREPGLACYARPIYVYDIMHSLTPRTNREEDEEQNTKFRFSRRCSRNTRRLISKSRYF